MLPATLKWTDVSLFVHKRNSARSIILIKFNILQVKLGLFCSDTTYLKNISVNINVIICQ